LQIELAQFPNARVISLFAADDQGFYDDEQLDVLVNPPDPGVDPVSVVMTDDPDNPTQFLFAPALVAMKANADGADFVNIAQIYQRSGQRILTQTEDKITSASQLASLETPLGTLPSGRDMDAIASLVASGVSASALKTQVEDAFDPTSFLGGDPTAM